MSGISVGAVVAAAAVATVGVGAYEAYQGTQNADFAKGIASNQFGEQQQFASMLMQLLSNPSSFASNPAYQFALKTGSATVADQMAGSGYAGSGNEALALQKFGQQEAYGGLLSQEQLLASLSGLQASSSAAQNVGAATSAQNSSFNQFLSMLPILGATTGGVGNLFAGGGGSSGVNFGGSIGLGTSASGYAQAPGGYLLTD